MAFTTIIVAAGILIHSDAHIEEGTQKALLILLGMVELFYGFARFIVHRLNAVARDSMAVIPQSGLSKVLYTHLDARRSDLLARAQELATIRSCELDKTEMYRELIDLTRTVTTLLPGHPSGTILAVSSTNIEDFDDEPLADEYLAANQDAAERHIRVQRVFLLDANELRKPEIVSIVRRHGGALRGRGSRSSDVRWLNKADIDRADRQEDFALFATDALISQLASGNRFSLTQNNDQIARAIAVFYRLWNSDQVCEVGQLEALRRR